MNPEPISLNEMVEMLKWLKVGLNQRISEANTAIEQTEEMLKNSNGKFNGKDKKLARVYMERIADVRKMSSQLQKLLKFLPVGLRQEK